MPCKPIRHGTLFSRVDNRSVECAMLPLPTSADLLPYVPGSHVELDFWHNAAPTHGERPNGEANGSNRGGAVEETRLVVDGCGNDPAFVERDHGEKDWPGEYHGCRNLFNLFMGLIECGTIQLPTMFDVWVRHGKRAGIQVI